MFILRNYQRVLKEGLYASWREGHRNVCLVAPTGCHSKDANVIMYDGSIKNVTNVAIGDMLMGPDSNPRRVKRLHSGYDGMYEVTPIKGEPFIVNANHIFHLWRTRQSKKDVGGKYVEMTCAKIHTSSKWSKHLHKLHRGSFDKKDISLPIDPWVLGVIIGDGSIVSGTPVITTPDVEIVSGLNEWVDAVGLKLNLIASPDRCENYSITDPSSSWRNPNKLTAQLNMIGLWGKSSGTKHIPPIYKKSSISQRLEMIAGLIDTDGHMCNNTYDWVSKSQELANDLVWLCRSVGLAAYISKCTKSCQTGYRGVYWRVSISGECSIIPCRIERKIASTRKQIKRHNVTGFTTNFIGIGRYYGFELDGDHLYMTDDFIIHHNSGKTVVAASIAKDMTESGCVIAHRTELVGQISMAMAQTGIVHNIIASSNTVKFCISQHIGKLGEKFYNPNATVTVASVDTLNARAAKLKQWSVMQRWWMVDECHHNLKKNKWGRAVSMFPNAYGVGFTATPVRADRKSLHWDQGGMFNDMVVGPSMRKLINNGSLCDYRIFVPPQSMVTSDIPLAASGDFSKPVMTKVARESQIVGDVVQHYLQFAKGLRGITFVVDVEQATTQAKAFNDAGVPAMAVSAKTPDAVRAEAVRKLKSGKILQLVNVDLFGEGFDVPAVEVVSMARPTMSYGLYVQQFGRALRTEKGKSHGIIIDHVGNVKVHGLPDAKREWTLWNEERGTRRSRDEKITPVTSCPECFAAYEAVTPMCPFCGHKPEPASRNGPEFVDGDLIEIDADTLARMRGDVDRIDGAPIIPHNATPVVKMSVKKQWRLRQEAQTDLRNHIAIWAGLLRDGGAPDSEIYRRFYHRFGIDVMSAQVLSTKPANDLSYKITETYNENN